MKDNRKNDDWKCWDCIQTSIFMCVVVEKKMHLIQGCILGKELLLTVVKELYMTRIEGGEFGFRNVCQRGNIFKGGALGKKLT